MRFKKIVCYCIATACYAFINIGYTRPVTLNKINSSIGDSIILMYGNSITHQGNWEELLDRKDVINWGYSGWTTQQLSWTIQGFLSKYKHVKICFIEGGINDFTLGISTKRIFSNQKMVLDSIAHQHIIPVYQTTFYHLGEKKTNREIDKLNGLIKKFCDERGYFFLDLRGVLSKNGDQIPEYTTDGVHLKPIAYNIWAKEIIKVLKKYDF